MHSMCIIWFHVLCVVNLLGDAFKLELSHWDKVTLRGQLKSHFAEGSRCTGAAEDKSDRKMDLNNLEIFADAALINPETVVKLGSAGEGWGSWILGPQVPQVHPSLPRASNCNVPGYWCLLMAVLKVALLCIEDWYIRLEYNYFTPWVLILISQFKHEIHFLG